ncbi:MAG: alanine racemase C-terminal domain-containing protein, partial [Oscillospiraceae bacterium]|nr:alanine racemase C-terminal domain-containing protein [Oscillospiraceae bacterium]
GRTYCTPAPRRVAVLPIGYADGLPRRLSNRVSFLVGGKQAPVIGRICMDMCMVDVSEAGPVGVGDEVVVFGPVPGANRCDDLAAQLDTISYELTCDINKRMTRLYFQGGRQVGILQYIV